MRREIESDARALQHYDIFSYTTQHTISSNILSHTKKHFV